MTCKIENCSVKVKGRGLCNKHLIIARRRGDFGYVKCARDGCAENVSSRGLCIKHYTRAKHDGEFGPTCSEEGCAKGTAANGLCTKHVARAKASGKFGTDTCVVDGCTKFKFCREFCPMHYARWEKYGDPGEVTMRRAEDGVGYIDSSGYRCVRGQKEHRLVMETVLGRPLLTNENVHHKNGDKLDNRPENLELWVVSQPCGQRPQDLLKWAHEIIDRYQAEFGSK